MVSSILSGASRANVLAIRQTQNLISDTTQRIASGLRVGSATDNPQNFFTASGLGSRASILNNRLDAISSGIRTIQQASSSLNVIQRFLAQGQSNVDSALAKLRAAVETAVDSDAAAPLGPNAIRDVILADNPVAYWRLNDAGATADNQGSIGAAVDGTISGSAAVGADALFEGGDQNVQFDGTSGGGVIVSTSDPAINGAAQTNRTIELFFKADDTGALQTLYEEGDDINYLRLSVLGGSLAFFVGSDSGFGPAAVVTEIEADTVYHALITYDGASGDLIGYLNGEEFGTTNIGGDIPAHAGNIGIGLKYGSSFAVDSDDPSNEYFAGQISDVAIYNSVLSLESIAERAAFLDSSGGSSAAADISTQKNNFSEILNQIRSFTIDRSFAGNSLLKGENLRIAVNEGGDNAIEIDGQDFSFSSFNIDITDFIDEGGLEKITSDISAELDRLINFASSLENSLGIVSTRQTFIDETINTLRAGQQDLTLADINEESANLLAAQTQLDLSVIGLALGSQSNGNIFDFLV